MESTSEKKLVLQLAREIARDKLAPNAAEIDRSYGFPAEGLRHLAQAGLMGLVVPPPFGGAGADTVSFVGVTEEIARACANTALIYVTHLIACMGILVGGKDGVKKTVLPAMARGEKLGAFAATEAACGANAFALQTTAKRTENGPYHVSGSKVFITSGGQADIYLVAVRTSNAPGPAALSALLVEKGTRGFTTGRKDRRLGINGTSSSELFFDDCQVPAENLLGQEGGYMAVGMPMIGLALLGASAIAVGIAQAALEASIEHAKSRKVNGLPIGGYQGVQFLVSEMSAQVEAARCLLRCAAEARDKGPSPLPLLPFQTKLFCTEMAIDVTNKALQVHGGQGYTQELPVERYFRDARGLTLHFTPSEMLKEMLGKMLLGMFP
ncbi:MAG: acyl-CoA dehydrogenase family protein [Chloroflexi bacterium]|nr:acyl-CoA dehydrogenase family protein [Chloroflexota bacterium]